MGYYINPTGGMTKEAWLMGYGRPLKQTPMKHIEGESMAVCLVNNGPFTAAAICYSQHELEAFANSRDRRRKQWFMVPKEFLAEFM